MSEEDYDIQSLATYLHLTPAQVVKMANRGQLPCRKVGGQWKFSRIEIHHWFETRIGASDQTELQQVEKVLDSEATDEDNLIHNMLKIEAIWIPLVARTKASVIQTVCKHAADLGLLWDPEKMVVALKSREELHPTALGNGVALLHPRRPIPGIMDEPFLALGITSSGIPFGGPRGSLTDIFFLIASSDEKGHLRTLARLSRIIGVPEFLTRLRDCANAFEAWELVRITDQEL